MVSLTIDGLMTRVMVPVTRLPGNTLLISPMPGAMLFGVIASSRSNSIRPLRRVLAPSTASTRVMKFVRVWLGVRSCASFELLYALLVWSRELFGSGDRNRSA